MTLDTTVLMTLDNDSILPFRFFSRNPTSTIPATQHHNPPTNSTGQSASVETANSTVPLEVIPKSNSIPTQKNLTMIATLDLVGAPGTMSAAGLSFSGNVSN